jgi:hypothetical protein
MGYRVRLLRPRQAAFRAAGGDVVIVIRKVPKMAMGVVLTMQPNLLLTLVLQLKMKLNHTAALTRCFKNGCSKHVLGS